MSVEIRFRRDAHREYEEAVDWYEQRRAGLGIRFALAIDEQLSAIADQPDRFPEVWPGTREAIVSDWPFCIYYQTHDDHVMIIAVFHTSRNPEAWQRRT